MTVLEHVFNFAAIGSKPRTYSFAFVINIDICIAVVPVQTHPELVDDVKEEGWVSTSDEDDRIPDICVYLAGEMSKQEPPRRVPELIFEFVSANREDQERDYIHKREEYHRIGVRKHVIVDRFKRSA